MFVQLSTDELSALISFAFDMLEMGKEVTCNGSDKSSGELRDICSRELKRLFDDVFDAGLAGVKVVMISINDLRLTNLILPPQKD